MSYQPPSWKSTSALPLQLTVTTRPTRSPNRFNSVRAGLTRTNWSVHSVFSASICSAVGLLMAQLGLRVTERLAVRRRGRVKVEALDEPAGVLGAEVALHPTVLPIHR